MDSHSDILPSVSLFHDIAPDDLSSMLQCLGAKEVSYRKGEHILSAGEKPENIGIVLSGQVHIVKEDMDGKRSLLASLAAADIFAEAFCSAGIAESPVTVLAASDADVMLLGFSRILQSCPNSCRFHQKLIANMLKVISQKIIYLQSHMEIVRARSVRAKVLSFLNGNAKKRGEPFTIPLNREEMADYLCVERSALSHELMRMKRDGMIEYSKNRFTLL